MATLRLQVQGMHCGNCKMKVERAVKSLPGVFGVYVDVQRGEAEVDFDGQTPAEKVIEAVRSVGYGAQVAA